MACGKDHNSTTQPKRQPTQELAVLATGSTMLKANPLAKRGFFPFLSTLFSGGCCNNHPTPRWFGGEGNLEFCEFCEFRKFLLDAEPTHPSPETLLSPPKCRANERVDVSRCLRRWARHFEFPWTVPIISLFGLLLPRHCTEAQTTRLHWARGHLIVSLLSDWVGRRGRGFGAGC